MNFLHLGAVIGLQAVLNIIIAVYHTYTLNILSKDLIPDGYTLQSSIPFSILVGKAVLNNAAKEKVFYHISARLKMMSQ